MRTGSRIDWPRIVTWTTMTLLGLGFALFVVLMVMGGCQRPSLTDALPDPGSPLRIFGSPSATGMTGREEAVYRLRNAANAMGWVGGLCALVAVGTLIASFFVPIIPRKLSWYCLAGAALGWATQYFLLVYGQTFAEIAIWCALGVGLVMLATVGLPWLTAFFRLHLLGKARVLKATDDLRAAVALEAIALPERFPDSATRKNRLVQLNDDRDRRINGGAA